MMIHEEEFELHVNTPERVAALGFTPQKEILLNHLLPYAHELDAESTAFLQQVKTNLAKAVMLREMKPAVGVWSSRLMKFIRLHGLKFGKEDHIAFIKLTYELLIIPELEPYKVHKFITLMLLLTKKRYVLSPEDLTIPWRPLYEMGKKMFDKSATHSGMYRYVQPKCPGKQGDMLDMVRKLLSGSGHEDTLSLFGLADLDENELPTSMESSFGSMIKCLKPYFELSATKEILEEMLPQIGPWSTDSAVINNLVVFLPVTLNPKDAAHGHELWLHKLMELWDTCYNAQDGITDLAVLFSGLAKQNPGSVDWSPYISQLFTRFLQALSLPVSYKDMQIARNNVIIPDMKYIANMIVWAINPDGVVLKHLRSFMGGVESYLRSANAGRWSFKLRDLLKKLSREFVNRVRAERDVSNKKSWQNKTPEAFKLRDIDITEFVNIMFEPTSQAVYSRSGAVDITAALHSLAVLRPAIVVPPLLEKLRTSLTSLTEPHRVTIAMSAVAAIARPMLRGSDAGYPEGPTHVVPILMSVLPGIDPNDLKKTLVTMHFILIFMWMVPVIDCSSAHRYWPDLTEEEQLACESTAEFEDFVLVYLDRIFLVIEIYIQDHVRLDAKESDFVRNKTDVLMESSITSTSTAIFMQSSPSIFNAALRKVKNFATQTSFEPYVSGHMVGSIIRVLARVNPEATLAAFVPSLCEELTELLSTDEALHEENPSRDVMYRLGLLMYVVECNKNVVLQYIPQILPVLDRALKLHANSAIFRAAHILNHLIATFSSTDLKEWRSTPYDYSTAPEKWLPVREWGTGCSMKNIDFEWIVPSEKGAECVQMLLDRYMKHEVLRLRQWLSGERPMSRERRARCFYIINASLTCNVFLPLPKEDPVVLTDTQVPAQNMPFNIGTRYEVTLDGENIRVALTDLLLKVQERMFAEKSDETRNFEWLSQIWERITTTKILRTSPALETRLRSFSSLDRALDGRGASIIAGGKNRMRLRMLLADSVRVQEDARHELNCDASITPTILKGLHALFDLSVNQYSSVRALAQMRLYRLFYHYPYSYRTVIPRLVEILATEGEGEEWHSRHKGALYMLLGPRVGPLIAKQEWDIAKTLWLAILKAPLSEKKSIVRLEQCVSESLHRSFSTVNTRLTITQEAVNAASYFLSEDELAAPSFAKQLSEAVNNEIAHWEKVENEYKLLLESLVDVAETPNLQWRRLELTMQMLSCCPLLQTNYTPSVVKFILKSLIHENIMVRKTAMRIATYILKQRKRPIKKIMVDPYEVAGVPKPEKHVPGFRKDLEWALWSPRGAPKTDEEWDKPWLKNVNYGFYMWPNKLQVAAPAKEQFQSYNLRPEEMEEGERYIHDFFSDEDNVEELVGFLTTEEKKGKDKFNGVRFAFFRMLFAQFGDEITKKFLSHAERCSLDVDESLQRFAAEVTAAALRAPKYWTKKRAENLYPILSNIIRGGLIAVTPETMEDWGTCLATGLDKFDPNRGNVIIKDLLYLCAPESSVLDERDKEASFVICSRLFALQGALGSLSWRGAPLAQEILDRLQKIDFINHPYQNVRETVGSVLMTIFDMDLVFPGGERQYGPCLDNFLKSIQPQLAALYDENGDLVITTTASLSGAAEVAEPSCAKKASISIDNLPKPPLPVEVARLTANTSIPVDIPEVYEDITELSIKLLGPGLMLEKAAQVKKLNADLKLGGTATTSPTDHATAVNLLTTVLRACMGVTMRAVNGNVRAQLQLAGVACGAASRGAARPPDELPRAAAAFLAALAPAHHSRDTFRDALRLLPALAAGRSWWARLAALEFAQPLLFYGLPLLCETPDNAKLAEEFTMQLMRDPRLEVRQAAAKLLTGLMHCRALINDEATIAGLKISCQSKNLVERHCGILGLCAYLGSRPYGIIPNLSEILKELSKHSGGPDPIPATIRKALADFRRTHQDDWSTHREQLTREELDLLADLTSPPSYCA